MENKLCKNCNQEKKLELMVKKEGSYRFQCKECRNKIEREKILNDPALREKERLRGKEKYQKNKEKHCQITKKYYNENLEWRKEVHLKNTYGITMDYKIKLREEQDNKCFICEKVFENDKSAYIDHCHITKKVRGLLCHNCNSGLGYFKDTINNLKKAIEYLEKHSI